MNAMKWTLAAAALAAALCFGARPGLAYSGNDPWCAVVSLGNGDVMEDCHYRTFEECVPNVLAGNRGTCGPNPRWEGWRQSRMDGGRHHKRRFERY